LTADTSTPFTSNIRSDKQYLKQYDQLVASSSQPVKETAEQSTKQPVDKQKKLRYAKALQKDDVRPLTPFRFDVLAQLANIPARITLYELLRLSKSTTEVLREALADSEIFLAQIPAIPEEDDGHCHQASRRSLCITFSLEDMQIKGKHDRALYYIGYIGSSKVSRALWPAGSYHPSIERYTDYQLWLLCQWYTPDGQDQTQMSDQGFEV